VDQEEKRRARGRELRAWRARRKSEDQARGIKG